MSERATKYMQRRCENLQMASCEILRDFDDETIHFFRVEFKKLRAVLRVYNSEEKYHNRIKIGNKIKSFYKATGTLRNLQIANQVITCTAKKLRQQAPLHFLGILHHLQLIVEDRILEQNASLSFNRLAKRISKATCDKKIKRASVKRWLVNEGHNLVAHASQRMYTDEDLHELRKMVKDLLYVRPLAGKKLRHAFRQVLLANDACAELGQMLGEFQDICNVVSHIQLQTYIDVPVQEKCTLTKILEYCLNRKAALKNMIAGHLYPLND